MRWRRGRPARGVFPGRHALFPAASAERTCARRACCADSAQPPAAGGARRAWQRCSVFCWGSAATSAIGLQPSAALWLSWTAPASRSAYFVAGIGTHVPPHGVGCESDTKRHFLGVPGLPPLRHGAAIRHRPAPLLECGLRGALACRAGAEQLCCKSCPPAPPRPAHTGAADLRRWKPRSAQWSCWQR